MANTDPGYIDTVGGMPEHNETYGSFVDMCVGGVLACLMIMVALAAVGFASTAGIVFATIGLFVGLIVILISLVAGLSFVPSIFILAGMTFLALVL